jgi:MoxR-like ATPase
MSQSSATQSLCPSPQRVRDLIDALGAGLLERDAAVRLGLLAVLAGEHLLLVGPPGTAKSELARRLHRALDGGAYFERLLTRFSTPEELFGPLSLKALEDDRYERLTAGFLPEAGIAFLDEVFKANSAILNALLTLLNEREFDNGSGRLRTPLVSVIGASNELPADESLLAFLDRFLLRVPVAPVGDDAFDALLALPDDDRSAGACRPLSGAERASLLEAAAAIRLAAPALDGMRRLRAFALAAGRPVSDRRWRQTVRLMRVAVAAEGRDAIDALDLWLAPYVVGAAPEDMPALERWFVADWMQAVPQQAPWLTRAVEAFERQLEIEQRAEPEGDDAGNAGKLALARAIGAGGERGDGGMLRIVSRQLEQRLARRWSPVHVAARVAQVDEIAARARAGRDDARSRHDELAAALAGRLWLPPALASTLIGAHARTLAVLDDLLQRLQATREGFAALPVDDGAIDEAPPLPIDLEPLVA